MRIRLAAAAILAVAVLSGCSNASDAGSSAPAATDTSAPDTFMSTPTDTPPDTYTPAPTDSGSSSSIDPQMADQLGQEICADLRGGMSQAQAWSIFQSAGLTATQGADIMAAAIQSYCPDQAH